MKVLRNCILSGAWRATHAPVERGTWPAAWASFDRLINFYARLMRHAAKPITLPIAPMSSNNPIGAERDSFRTVNDSSVIAVGPALPTAQSEKCVRPVSVHVQTSFAWVPG